MGLFEIDQTWAQLARRAWGFLAVSLLVALCGSQALAQVSTGTILGTVKDSSGAVIAAAMVTVTNTETGFTRTSPTAVDGSYRFPELPVGQYQVHISHDGFEAAERSGLTLEVAQEAVVDITLQVGAATQTVTVTEAAPLVDTTTSSVGGTVNEERVADLPLNGRNWTDLTLMQAGVSKINIFVGTTGQAGQNGTIYISNGATDKSNMYLLDGADERTLAGYNNTSTTNSALGVDGIEEYKVVSVLPDASYALAMGSQTTLVSKGGTNQLHGDAFDYIRNASLDARNYFDALDTADANGFGTNKSVVYPGKRLPPFRRNDFGGSFGGPVKKDKTFFYLVFEGVNQGLGVTETKVTMPKACFFNNQTGALQATIPAQILNTNSSGTCIAGAPNVINVSPVVLPLAAIYPQPNVVGYPTFNYTFPFIQPSDEQYGQARIDHIFSDSDTLFFRYTEDDAKQTASNGMPPFNLNNGSGSKLATLSETHVFSPTLLNTFRSHFQRNLASIANSLGNFGNIAAAQNPAAWAIQPNTGPATPVTGLVPPTSPGSGITGIGTSIGPEVLNQNIYTWSDDVFWTKGKHALKFGTLVNYYQVFYVINFELAGDLIFPSLTNFFTGDYSQIQAVTPNSVFGRDFHSETYGFYAQDDYRVNSRLTLNLGLRYEFSTVPVDVNPALRYSWRNPIVDKAPTYGNMFADPSLHDFSPRIGFAWDVFGNGKTSIRGGAGLYYDIGNYYSFYSGDVTSTPPINTNVITNNALPVPAVPLVLPLSGALIGATPVPPSPRSNSFYIGQPSLLQRSLIIGQALPWQMGLTVGYVGSQGWNLYKMRDGNPTVAVGRNSVGLPIYGCWNAADTSYLMPTASGSCPTGFTNFGPRTNTALGQTDFVETGANSYYNSLQVSLDKRLTQGFQFQFNYTWSKIMDSGQGAQFTEGVVDLWEVPDGYNTRFDRGPAIFDNTSNARINFIYHAPTLSSEGIAGKLLNGWWASSIISAQSGYPITPLLGPDRALQNDNMEKERPNLDPSFNKSSAVIGKVSEWFNSTMFDVPAAGTLGTAGRGIIRGPGLTEVDFSLVKDTKVGFLGEAGNVEFRAEMFNLLNHPNFALPNSTVWSPAGAGAAPAAGQIGTTADPQFATAGQITSTITTSRQVQFALKLIF